MSKSAINLGSQQDRAIRSSFPAAPRFLAPRVSPVANLLSAVEVEVLAREIETITAGAPFGNDNASKDQFKVQAVAADIESLFIQAAKPRKPVPAKFKRHEQLRKTAEKIYLAAIKGVLAHAEAEVLANLRSSKAILGVEAVKKAGSAVSEIKTRLNQSSEDLVKAGDAAISSVNFDLGIFEKSFLEAMNGAGKAAWKVTSRGLLTELGAGQAETGEGIISKFLIKRENKLSGCPQSIFDQIARSLQEGVDGGETMDDLSDRVQEEFGEIEEGRAVLIAQTESQCVYGVAQMDALGLSGFTTKRWVTMDDELVRPSHAEAGDEVVGKDEPFSNGLMFPGDPDGDAGEVCNCRCYLAPGDEDEETDGGEDV